MPGSIRSYKDLIVWQKAMDVVILTYKLTEKFPGREVYALVSQMRRSAVSIPSNIAEGRGRGTRKDFVHFVRMAYGSASELQTQYLIAKRLEFIHENDATHAFSLLDEVIKMLRSMILKLEAKS